MEHIGKSPKLKKLAGKNRFLHSKNHLLADELSKQLSDIRHFGFYLKMAMLYNHSFLRKLASEVLESKSVQTPGKLFAYLIKKHNQEIKSS